MIKHILKSFKEKLKRSFEHKIITLCYHRIADLKIDPWQLAVSKKNFEEQLQVLQKLNVISSEELSKQLENRSVKSHSVCLSFDDGYSDNFYAAKPLLEKYNTPSTFFIATGFIDTNLSFWWDELQHLILGPHPLPKTLSIFVAEELFSFDLGDDAFLPDVEMVKHQSWLWFEPPPNNRCKLYLELWSKLKPLKNCDIEEAMNAIRRWANVSYAPSESDIPITKQELLNFSQVPLFNIGIHTITHPALAFHSFETQYQEIAGSKNILEEVCNREISSIAYPYGNYNEVTMEVVKRLNLSSGFTTNEKLITKSDNRFQLGRFQVKNWNGEEFERELYKWKREF